MTAHSRAAARSISIAVVASIIVIGACHKKPEVAPAPAPAPAAPSIDSTAIRDSIARAQAARDAALARQRAYDDSVRRANEASAAAGEQTGLRNTVTAVVHFDFDRSELRDDARATLDAKVPVLMANPISRSASPATPMSVDPSSTTSRLASGAQRAPSGI